MLYKVKIYSYKKSRHFSHLTNTWNSLWCTETDLGQEDSGQWDTFEKQTKERVNIDHRTECSDFISEIFRYVDTIV